MNLSGKVVDVDSWVERPLSDLMKALLDSNVSREHREYAYLEWHWKKASLLSRRLVMLRREVTKLEAASSDVDTKTPIPCKSCGEVVQRKDTHFADFVRSIDSRTDLDDSKKRTLVTAYARQICLHLSAQIQSLRKRRNKLTSDRRIPNAAFQSSPKERLSPESVLSIQFVTNAV